MVLVVLQYHVQADDGGLTAIPLPVVIALPLKFGLILNVVIHVRTVGHSKAINVFRRYR